MTLYYREYQEDMLKSDVSMAFVGSRNMGYINGDGQITRKLKDINYIDLNSVQSSTTKINFLHEIDRKSICPANKHLEPSSDCMEFNKKYSKNCSDWSCKFLYHFTTNMEAALNDSNNSTIQYFSDAASILFESFSDTSLFLKIEQLKNNPFSLAQFLFDLKLLQSNKTEVKQKKLHLSSSSNGSFIQYGKRKLALKDSKMNNTLILIMIDKTCKRRFINFKIIESNRHGQEIFNSELQKLDFGDVLGFVQFGFFDWNLIFESSIYEFLKLFGMKEFSSNAIDTLSRNNNIFIGFKGLQYGRAIHQISFTSLNEMELDIYSHEIFKLCDDNSLYVRAESSFLEGFYKMRIISLQGKVLTKNKEVGLTLTIITCSNSDKNSSSVYQKAYEKNFDLHSASKTLKDLNADLSEFILKDYYGTPLFIISSFGNYEQNWQVEFDEWRQFSINVEKLGGQLFLEYLTRTNLIIYNGKTIDIGHPYILVGSPKFKKYEAYEYKASNWIDQYSNSSQSDVIFELKMDMGKKKLKCPQIYKRLEDDIVGREEKMKEEFFKEKIDFFEKYLNFDKSDLLEYPHHSDSFRFKSLERLSERIKKDNKLKIRTISNKNNDLNVDNRTDQVLDDYISNITTEFLNKKVLGEKENTHKYMFNESLINDTKKSNSSDPWERKFEAINSSCIKQENIERDNFSIYGKKPNFNSTLTEKKWGKKDQEKESKLIIRGKADHNKKKTKT